MRLHCSQTIQLDLSAEWRNCRCCCWLVVATVRLAALIWILCDITRRAFVVVAVALNKCASQLAPASYLFVCSGLLLLEARNEWQVRWNN